MRRDRVRWVLRDHPIGGMATIIPITIPPEEADAWDLDHRAGRSAVHCRPPDDVMGAVRRWLFADEASAPPLPEQGLQFEFISDEATVCVAVIPVLGGTLLHERTLDDDGVVQLVEELFAPEEWLVGLSRYVADRSSDDLDAVRIANYLDATAGPTIHHGPACP